MQLLERDRERDGLRAAFEGVRAGGTGACAVLSGEAGIGKSALARAFLDTLPADVPRLVGRCEPLFTPRPLGPWLDVAHLLPPSLEHALLQGQAGGALFTGLLRHFSQPGPPSVLLIEDAHWADVGSLDLLHYLVRRLGSLRLLLVLTHRDEGLDAVHPLRGVLGDLPPHATTRLPLAPLSRRAVALWAERLARDGNAIYALAGGNPFYVTEALAHPAGLPPTVRDMVLAELTRLEPAARQLAQWVSLFTGPVEREVVLALAGSDAAAIDAGVRSGLLVEQGRALAFRHDIARSVVYGALRESHRIDGHAAAHAMLSLRAATGGPPDLARRVHHASAAGLTEAVAALAPHAAAQAAASGAHREAERLYRLALQPGTSHDDAERADLLERLADELTLNIHHREAIAAREEALTLHRARGDRLREGIGLRALARLHWLDKGSRGPARRCAQEAVRVLEGLDADAELALAYSSLAHKCLLADDTDEAQAWAQRGLDLAQSAGSPQAECHALNTLASIHLRLRDDPLGFERMQRSIAIAREHRLHGDVARGGYNLFLMALLHRHLDAALTYAQQCIDHAETHGLDVHVVRTLIRRAFAHIVMGRWDRAAADLDEVARRHERAPAESAAHGLVAALLALRQGAPGSIAGMRQAVHTLIERRVEIWFTSTAALLAEAAWLEGDAEALARAARPALEALQDQRDAWRAGDLACWLQRAGQPLPALHGLALPRPHGLVLAGRVREAAAAWNDLGCPYDRALALCSGDAADQAEALKIFESLGADAAAARVRGLLRQQGVRGVPRGPQPRTRDDPLGLTTREREVFDLLRAGLSNAAIAARLHRSERTVEHHVAALLHKLGLRSRVELLARYPADTAAK